MVPDVQKPPTGAMAPVSDRASPGHLLLRCSQQGSDLRMSACEGQREYRALAAFELKGACQLFG